MLRLNYYLSDFLAKMSYSSKIYVERRETEYFICSVCVCVQGSVKNSSKEIVHITLVLFFALTLAGQLRCGRHPRGRLIEGGRKRGGE